MSRIWETNKKLLTGLAFIFCFIMVVSLTVSLMLDADAANHVGSYAFSSISSSATQFFNKSQSPENGSGLPDIGLFRPTAADDYTGIADRCYFGNAGGLLGYEDEFDSESSFVIAGTGSGNTVIYEYSSLRDNIRLSGETNTSIASIFHGWEPCYNTAEIRAQAASSLFSGYGYFGYALSELGLDETAMGGGNNILRLIVGVLMMALYAMSVSVNVFFDLVFTILSWANPFRLFLGGLNEASDALRYWTLGTTKIGEVTVIGTTTVGRGQNFGSAVLSSVGEGISSLAGLLTRFYNLLMRFSILLIIPTMIIISIFTWLVVKKGGEFGKIFKPLAIRIVFVFIGVPLMFATYSAAIDTVRNFAAVSNSVSSEVVFSTFFDFESWVHTSRLGGSVAYGLTDASSAIAVTLDGTGKPSVSGSSVANARKIAYMINRENYNNSASGDLFGSKDSFLSTGIYTEDTDAGISESSAKLLNSMSKYDSYFMNKNKYTYVNNVSSDAKLIRAATNLLQRYIKGDVITAAGYQSKITSEILSTASDKTDVKYIQDAYTEYDACCSWYMFDPDNASDFTAKSGSGSTGSSKVDNLTWTEAEMKSRAKDRFKYSSSGSEALTREILWNSGGLYVRYGTEDMMIKNRPVDSGKTSYGLSAVAMYNYLSSSFDGSKITVYSAANTTSDQVQVGHYAVTSVGSGLIRIIYLLDALCLLGCITVLGYGYGFGLIMANFKVLMKLIPSIFSGMLGSLSGIAKSLALLAAMIVELMGTFILYYVSCELVFTIYSLVEGPLLVLLNRLFGENSVIGNLVPIIFGVVSCAVLLAITKKLLEYRVVICKAVTDACSDVIGKFVGGKVGRIDLHDGMSAANIASMGISAGMVASAMVGGPSELRDKITALGKGEDGTEGGEGLDVDGGLSGTVDDAARDARNNGVKYGNGTGERVGFYGGDASFTEGDVFEPDADGKGLKPGEAAGDGSTMDVKGSISGPDESGKNAETQAAEYVAMNQEEFERSVMESAVQRDAERGTSSEEKAKNLALDKASDARGSLVMTDANGNQSKGLQVVRSDNGQNYSVADKMEGQQFTVIDTETGEVYRDAAGRSYENMDAKNISINSDSGEIRTIQTADGSSRMAVMAESDVGRLNVTDSSGETTKGIKVVNAETGEAYTMMDQADGKAFTVVNSDGSIYVDSEGNTYENVDASMVEMSKETGQVTRFGTRDEDGEVVVNTTVDGNAEAYGYSSVMTSKGASDLVRHPEGPSGARTGGSGGGTVIIARGGDKTDVKNETRMTSQVRQGDTYSDTHATVGGVQYMTKEAAGRDVVVDGGGSAPVVIPVTGSKGGTPYGQVPVQQGGGTVVNQQINVRQAQPASTVSQTIQNINTRQAAPAPAAPSRDTTVHVNGGSDVQTVKVDGGRGTLPPSPAPMAPKVTSAREVEKVTERTVETVVSRAGQASRAVPPAAPPVEPFMGSSDDK